MLACVELNKDVFGIRNRWQSEPGKNTCSTIRFHEPAADDLLLRRLSAGRFTLVNITYLGRLDPYLNLAGISKNRYRNEYRESVIFWSRNQNRRSVVLCYFGLLQAR